MIRARYQLQLGRPYPLGATVDDTGVNFAVASRAAEQLLLCLFDEDGEKRFVLHRTGDVWHGYVQGAGAGLAYGFRVFGQHHPEQGLFANPHKLLLDPYAKTIHGTVNLATDDARAWFHHDDTRDNAHLAPKALCVATEDFDWGDDAPPRHAWHNSLIYEAHVKGLTQQFPDLEHAGTYLALADPRVIAHLKSLGITAVELLPIHQHLDEWQLQQRGLSNYWGYNTLSAFAPEPRYAHNPHHAAHELKTAVKALHAAGIEVILDVVYNHSAEQDIHGALLSQRGLDNRLWYWHDAQSALCNWSGCGNTVQIVEPLVTRWVLDSLRYWVQEFHIDGFRFDLATILAREPHFERDGKFFHALQQDPILAPCKLFAEAWDLDCYALGQFPVAFAQWNGAFRDDIRRFWLQGSGRLDLFAKRFAGSDDIFSPAQYRPSNSLNFITAHDGFTLQDLVSYHHKHNYPNGEDNRDGHHDNHSNNHGQEGYSTDSAVLEARYAAQSALLATLLLAKGTPMLLAGDELGHSQQGNNNAYCQDNPSTWLNWQQQPFRDTIAQLWALRAQIPALHEDVWLDAHHVQWLNPEGMPMHTHDWHNTDRKALQILLNQRWLILINGKHAPESFVLPHAQSALHHEAIPVWQCAFASMPHTFTLPICHVTQLGVWVFHLEES